MSSWGAGSEELTEWQKKRINNFRKELDYKPKVKKPYTPHYVPMKPVHMCDVPPENNARFEEEWEAAKKLIIDERKKWEYN